MAPGQLAGRGQTAGRDGSVDGVTLLTAGRGEARGEAAAGRRSTAAGLTRRQWLGLAPAAALAACRPAAGPAGDAGASPAGVDGRPPVPIELLAGLTAQQRATFPTLVVAAFESAHPSRRLRLVEQGTSYDEQLLALQAAGNPPDVIYAAPPSAFLAGLTRPLDDYVKRDGLDLTAFSPEGFESACTWRGRISGLPYYFGGNISVLAYNRDLFREAGAPEPPAGWGAAEWHGAAFQRTLQMTTLRDAGGRLRSYGANLPNLPFYTFYLGPMFGGAWLTSDLQTVTCDGAGMIEGLEYLAALVAEQQTLATGQMLQHAFGEGAPEKVFLNGRLALYATWGAQNIGPVPPAVRSRGLDLAYAPLPAFKRTGAAHYYIANGITRGVRQPDAAWDYLRWATDTPNWCLSRGQPPARAELFDVWAREVHEGVAEAMRVEVYRESLRYPIPLDPLFHVPTNRQTQMFDLIRPALEAVWSGQATAAATLRALKPSLQHLVPRDLP
jgi:multiple sugar transport system substrate-binding protein